MEGTIVGGGLRSVECVCVGVTDGAAEGLSEDTWDGVQDTLGVGGDVDPTVGVSLKVDGCVDGCMDGRNDEDGCSDELGGDN